MDINRAKEILAALADGVNPITGEVLPYEDSCNQGEVVRALNTVLAALPEKIERKPAPENAGKPWSKEDDELLCRMFDEGKGTSELSKYFKRTNSSISARLVHLGKVENEGFFFYRKAGVRRE